jgi:L-asparaginase II
MIKTLSVRVRDKHAKVLNQIGKKDKPIFLFSGIKCLFSKLPRLSNLNVPSIS